MAFREHRDSGANRPGLALPASGGLAIPIPGRVRRWSFAVRRGAAVTVAVGKGTARSPRVAGPSIPSPGGATEAHQNRSRPYRACTRMAAHPGLRFACPGLADVGLSGQGGNRGNGEERGQDARDTRGRDALVTEQQRRRTRAGRPCYSRARRFGFAHRRRPCYERQRRRTRATPLRRRLRRAGMPARHTTTAKNAKGQPGSALIAYCRQTTR
jgi:hypothetical protein